MDLFEIEQDIYDTAVKHAGDVHRGAPHEFEKFETLAKEYGKLLKYIRIVVRFADRSAVNLYKNNIDLANKAHRDPLTDLYNRRFLEERFKKLIKDLSRSGSLLSVIMVDIDFFKKFNDTYGHNEGDYCLISIAQTLSECITRDSDFIARYGGEEFIIVLPNTDENGAQKVAKKILEKVIERGIPHEENKAAGCLTVSAGYTTIAVKHTHNSVDYIKCADEALYTSKRNGRNRFTYKQFKEKEKSG